MKTTKKQLIEVLQGKSDQSIEYKGINFKYCANNMTIKDCNEHIKEMLNR